MHSLRVRNERRGSDRRGKQLHARRFRRRLLLCEQCGTDWGKTKEQNLVRQQELPEIFVFARHRH